MIQSKIVDPMVFYQGSITGSGSGFWQPFTFSMAKLPVQAPPLI